MFSINSVLIGIVLIFLVAEAKANSFDDEIFAEGLRLEAQVRQQEQNYQILELKNQLNAVAEKDESRQQQKEYMQDQAIEYLKKDIDTLKADLVNQALIIERLEKSLEQ